MCISSLLDVVRRPSPGTSPNPTSPRALRMPGCMLTTLSRSSNIAGCAMSTNIASKRARERQAWATGSTPSPPLHSPKWRMVHSNGGYSTGLGLRHRVQGISVASNSLGRSSRARRRWTPLADMLQGAPGKSGIIDSGDSLVDFVKTTGEIATSEKPCRFQETVSLKLGKPELYTPQTYISLCPMARTFG